VMKGGHDNFRVLRIKCRHEANVKPKGVEVVVMIETSLLWKIFL